MTVALYRVGAAMNTPALACVACFRVYCVCCAGYNQPPVVASTCMYSEYVIINLLSHTFVEELVLLSGTTAMPARTHEVTGKTVELERELMRCECPLCITSRKTPE